jgi:hypothetical protein
MRSTSTRASGVASRRPPARPVRAIAVAVAVVTVGSIRCSPRCRDAHAGRDDAVRSGAIVYAVDDGQVARPCGWSTCSWGWAPRPVDPDRDVGLVDLSPPLRDGSVSSDGFAIGWSPPS